MIQRESLRIVRPRKGETLLAFAPGEALPGEIAAVPPEAGMAILGGIRMPHGIVRGVVREGRMVAWAVAREPDAAGVRHITVETDLHHRGKGYARACLLALVRDVPEPMIYLCDSRNLHSALTALSAGFVCVGTVAGEEEEG